MKESVLIKIWNALVEIADTNELELGDIYFCNLKCAVEEVINIEHDAKYDCRECAVEYDCCEPCSLE